MNKKTLLYAVVGILCSLQSFAQPANYKRVEAELISEVRVIRAGQPFWVAVRLRMQPHWHIYWRNPGDSGMATRIEWKLPPGFRTGPLQWPVPQKIPTPPFMSYGYSNQVFLLAKVYPPAHFAQKSPVLLKAHVEWLVCKEVCLPGEAELQLRLPATTSRQAVTSQKAAEISRALDRLPQRPRKWHFFASAHASFVSLHIHPPAGYNGQILNPYFFAEAPDAIEPARPQHMQHSSAGYQLNLELSSLRTTPLKRLRGVLVFHTGRDNSTQAFRLDLPVELAINKQGNRD